MRIAILGTGHMGRTLGTGFSAAGHDIVYGSREPEKGGDLPGAVTDHAAAIEGSDLVISALAAADALDALTALRESLDGKILIDIGNAVDKQMQLIYPTSSLGQKLQEALPGTRVVKALNTLPGTVTIDPSSLSAATTVFYAGDDDEAKKLVSDAIGDLGWAADTRIDLGGISSAQAMERYFSLFAALMQTMRGAEFNIAVIR